MTSLITDVRQRFGDMIRDEKRAARARTGIEDDAPFVGWRSPSPSAARRSIAASSRCCSPDARRVGAPGLEINGQTIFGGIAPSVDFESRILGSGSEAHQTARDRALERNVMLIHPNVPQENNILRVRAAEMTAGNVDDFVMDNVVVVFKTGRSAVANTGSVVATAKPRKKKRPAKRAKKRR